MSVTEETRSICSLAENFFREESGNLVSVLTKVFGLHRLQLAEDVVQEALARALRVWPYYGVPNNPAAWITQTAKNLALDVIRREKLLRNKESEMAGCAERWSAHFEQTDAAAYASDVEDAKLRLIFVCCHPLIPEETQASLALKMLCGFSSAEIANAFLTTEAAVNKRLTRAKQKLREEDIPYELPSGEDLTERLDGVLKTLYLLFNEGYKASSGDALIREELCREAIRLTSLVARLRTGNQPRTHALLSLMLLNTARLTTRVGESGKIVRLQDQDRENWDRGMIAQGLVHLGRSAGGNEMNWFHLQAGIAALHCTAKDYASTDWAQILKLYDYLIQIDDSPVVALNRAIAVAQVHGPSAGIEAVEAIRRRETLESYYLLYAVLAEFEVQVNDFASAADHLRQALQLTSVGPERSLLTTRLNACERQSLN